MKVLKMGVTFWILLPLRGGVYDPSPVTEWASDCSHQWKCHCAFRGWVMKGDSASVPWTSHTYSSELPP